MLVGEFNANISKSLTEAFETGQPTPIERGYTRSEFVSVISTSVLNELIQAAGEDAPKILRANPEQRKQEAAA